MERHTTDLSPGRAATVAGVGYLVILFFGIGNFVLQDLMVTGDTAATVANIADSALSFRLGIASWIVVMIADVVVAWALYFFFEPVSRAYSMLAAWLRVVFVAIGAVTLVNLAAVLPILSETGVERVDAVAASLATYGFGFNVAFVFFGLHILCLGYMILRSGRLPGLIGILLVVASAGYLIDSFASLLSSSYAGNEVMFLVLVAVPALISEYSLAGWLLLRGRKVELAGSTR